MLKVRVVRLTVERVPVRGRASAALNAKPAGFRGQGIGWEPCYGNATQGRINSSRRVVDEMQKGLQRGVESEMRVVTVKEQIEKLYTLSYYSLTIMFRVKV
jgi:hypothetical protein